MAEPNSWQNWLRRVFMVVAAGGRRPGGGGLAALDHATSKRRSANREQQASGGGARPRCRAATLVRRFAARKVSAPRAIAEDQRIE
jgi:hypothetical protein